MSRISLGLAFIACCCASGVVCAQRLDPATDTLTSYPAAATRIQGVVPFYDQRTVNFDGTTFGVMGGGMGMPPAGGGGGGSSGGAPIDHNMPLPIRPPSGGGGCAPGSELSDIPKPLGAAGGQTFGGMNLRHGIYMDQRTHLHLPQAGADWVISADHNSRQVTASAGPQGMNRFQGSMREVMNYGEFSVEGFSMVVGANGYQEFKLKSGTSDLFEAKNGAEAVAKLQVNSGSPDTLTVYTPFGTQFVYFGFDDGGSESGVVMGQLWKIIDAAGNTSYVGDSSSASTAKTSGYDASGRIIKAYDSADRRYTYTYGTVGGASMTVLTEVKAEAKTGGTWASPTGLSTVGKVEYSYYVDADTHGSDGDLKMVKVTTPLTDTGAEIVTKTYYRYYEGTYNATTNPGHPTQIKYIYESEGLRQFDWTDSTFDEEFLTASEADLKPYASSFFKYDSDKRVVEAWYSGACGCSGGTGSGTHLFSYESNGSFPDDPGYDTAWHSMTLMQEPDKGDEASATSKYVATYFDELGQVMATLTTEAAPSTEPARFWAVVYDRDWSTNALDGLVESIHTPANVTAYDYVSGGNVTYSFTLSTSAGLVTAFDRFTTGNFQGLVNHVKYKEGTSGAANLAQSLFYDRTTQTVTSVTVARPVIVGQTMYTIQTSTADAGPGNSPPSGAYRTEYTYDFYDDGAENAPLVIEDVLTTYPVVTTGNNGSNSASTSRSHFLKSGRMSFSKTELGIIGYYEYSATTGQMTKSIEDADTTQDGGGGEQTDFSGVTIPSGFDTDSPSAAFHMRRTMTYDRIGRLEKSVSYKAKSTTIEEESSSYVSKLADSRLISLHYPKFETSGAKYYGPVSMGVANHSGGTDVGAIIALDDNSGEFTTDAQSTHVDEADSDPILAVEAIGDLKRMNVSVHSKAGSRVDETRTYFLTPASGAGTEGTNFDSTYFGYDNLGRRWRTKDPTGTIRRTVYDAIGRVEEQWIGTNDNDTETTTTPEKFPGGETSGTSNMVKIEAMVYDTGASDDNSRLTKRTAFVQDNTTDQRETTFQYDFRGRMLLQTNPVAPHVFNKYDDAGRLIASGLFSSTANIALNPTPPTLPDDPTTETSNRLALSQTFYDEKGQVWKTQRHKIDDADGSDDDNLQELTWFDAAGKTIKVDGGQLSKTVYDRLSRATHQFVLAIDNDSAYADADDVAGDIVLQESQTTYDRDSGLVLMSAVIERFHDDYSTGETTGALDTNADGDSLLYTAANLEGRIQISANWYDSLDRLQDTVAYGNNGGANFDRDPPGGLSVPSRSDTALRTTQAYNADGTTLSVTDPKALVTRFAYDDAGRQVTVINNYVDGTPSGTTGADDVYTRHAYTDGLKTTMHVDFDGAGDVDAGDQVTTWTYGVTKGAGAGDSKIGAGHLLKKVIYPEQVGSQPEADKRVSYAYNAQGQTIWTEDQTTTVIQSDFDVGGRQTHRRVTTLGGGLDNAVLRISTTYDNLARRSLVTQYNNATVGSGSVTDEVKFTYDDWGNLASFIQDKDSAVATGGTQYTVSYTTDKVTTGRNTLRRSSATMPSGLELSLDYLSTGDLHDNDASRITQIRDGDRVVLAGYKYNGVGTVVGVDLPQPGLFNHRYASTSGQYPDLDNFSRVMSDTWYKDLATDRAIYDVDIAYDRNSNIIRTEDNVFPAAKDIVYTMDGLNRLNDAQWGTYSGGSITSEIRQRTWTLDQVGNWANDNIDTTNDADYDDTNDTTETRTHNLPNELLVRNRTQGTTELLDIDLVYNKRGDMTDDGEHYEYVYDAFGRLRKINRTDTQALVAEYHYNPLGFRRSWKYDTDNDGDVDGSDKTYHFAHDERWRIVATYRDTDATPKEEFIYHCAGLDGYGGSSYIDAVILRHQDLSNGWTGASDGTMEKREYYVQNWRADVVARIASNSAQIEQVRYGEYGVPFGLPAGDTDGDGDVDSTDTNQIQTWINGSAYDVRGDMDLDGDVQTDDKTAATANNGVTLGWGKLSIAGKLGGNRKGYAGYEFEPAAANYSLWHVRHRVLNSNVGRWTRRDPYENALPRNTTDYVSNTPIGAYDPMGLWLMPTYGDFPHKYGPCGQISCITKFLYVGPPLNEPQYFLQSVLGTWRCETCSHEETTYRYGAYELFNYIIPAGTTVFLFPGNDEFAFPAYPECEAHREQEGIMKLFPSSKFVTIPSIPIPDSFIRGVGSCCGKRAPVWGQWLDSYNLPFNTIDWIEADWRNLAIHSCVSSHYCCGCESRELVQSCHSTTIAKCNPPPHPTCP